MRDVSRRGFLGAAALGMAALAGCAGGGSGSASADGAAASDGASGAAAAAHVTVGTLATEDILPFWVAQDQGLFPQGMTVDIVVFQSASELIAGVASGEVDLAMTDIMVAASLHAGGAPVRMEWVTLGTTPQQGRFGIMVGPESDVQQLADLAGVPVGVGSNTILEYVMDQLMADAGIPADQIIVEELPKLPVRYQLMQSGEVAAAALPASLLALGEAQGCRTIADDTAGANLSQSVMVSRVAFARDEQGTAALDGLRATWDAAVDLVNADPEAYRALLVENANLPADIADTYPISEYPHAQLPTAQMVDPILAWSQEKGYLGQALAYDPGTGDFA